MRGGVLGRCRGFGRAGGGRVDVVVLGGRVVSSVGVCAGEGVVRVARVGHVRVGGGRRGNNAFGGGFPGRAAVGVFSVGREGARGGAALEVFKAALELLA